MTLLEDQKLKQLIDEIKGYRKELSSLQEEQAIIYEKSMKLMESAQTVQKKISAVIEERKCKISNGDILH
jgi:hypothetical protein